MSKTTVYLARLLGLFLLIMGISMLVQGQNTVATWIALIHDLPLVYFAGLSALAAGIAMVLSHNIWRGGLLPVIVSILAWITLLKGVFTLMLPGDLALQAIAGPLLDRYYYFYIVIWLVLGAYLTIEGYRNKGNSA